MTGTLVERRIQVEVAGIRMHARTLVHERSSLSPAVLVHGWGVSSRYLMPLARRLAAARDVFVPDLPGHGASGHPSRALPIGALADVLLRWMDETALERPLLVGNSMGCQVIVDLAARHPERVDAAILLGPTLHDEHGIVRQGLHLLADIPRERPSLIPLVAWDYLRMGPRLLIQELRHMFADRMLEKAAQVRARCLVVRGERDPVVPREWAERVAAALHALPVREVRGQGHALNYSAAEELMPVIAPFLDEVSP